MLTLYLNVKWHWKAPLGELLLNYDYDNDDDDDDDDYDYYYDISQADLVPFYFPRDRFVTYDQGTQGDSFSFLQISNTFLRIRAVSNNAVFFVNYIIIIIIIIIIIKWTTLLENFSTHLNFSFCFSNYLS